MGLRDEPLVRELLAKLPAQGRDSLTDNQIRTLLVALHGQPDGNRDSDSGSNEYFWRTYDEMVTLNGGLKNASAKGGSALAFLSRMAVMTGLLGALLVSLVVALYLVKSALGIDLLPGYSFGFWDWFKDAVLQPG